MLFHSIIGCESPKKYFRKIVSHGKIPHAQLFIDTSGGATLPLALAFITYIHCSDRRDRDSCGRCDSCQKMKSFTHPDLCSIFPIGAQSKTAPKQLIHPAKAWSQFLQEDPHGNLQTWSQILGGESKNLQIRREQVDQMRAFLNKKSFTSRYKTLLIWLPEHANPVAANAMLKMVEEPTPDTYFIFITTDPTSLLPTLYSRMWHIHIPKLKEEELLILLKKSYPQTSEILHQEALKVAKGNLYLAEKLVRGDLQNYFDTFSKWLRAAYRHSWKELLETAEAFHSYNPQTRKDWLAYALEVFHFILCHYCSTETSLHLTSEEYHFAKRLTGTLELKQIQAMSRHIMRLQEELQRNAYARLAFMSCSLHIAATFRSV